MEIGQFEIQPIYLVGLLDLCTVTCLVTDSSMRKFMPFTVLVGHGPVPLTPQGFG